MTEHYIAEAGLTDQVQQAAWQVAYGPASSGWSLPWSRRAASTNWG